MSEQTSPPRRSHRLPLGFRLSFILILAAVLPLLLTVSITEYFSSRPDLIDEANQTMVTDATTRTQAINAYLTERLLDAETLSQVGSVQSFMAEPDAVRTQDLSGAQHAGYALAAGEFRDKRYIVWMLFTPKALPALAYPTTIQPHQYGQSLVPDHQAQQVTNDKTGLAFYSPVYRDPATKRAFIDVYSPIYINGVPTRPLVGFLRASLYLDYIEDIVKSDRGIKSSGSSFIFDENGVRIADTNSDAPDLFTAVESMPETINQQILTENWYGEGGNVPVESNPTLASAVRSTASPNRFTLDLTSSGQSQNYQVVSYKTSILPWTYVVLSPSNAVTAVADQQLWITIIVAFVVAGLAALIGLRVSSVIGRPIMRSVDQLQDNSAALNGLAKKQQSASSEQMWVVDSVQVGLQSVQYYADATRIAAHKLGEVGGELERNWQRQNIDTIKQGLQHVIRAASYIEKASNFQSESSQKLATAIKVTAQVNEQLAEGALSATEAASQLEQVVNDLRNVVSQ